MAVLLYAFITITCIVLGQLAIKKRQEARFVQEHGCQTPPYYPLKDPIFGLDYLLEFVKAVQENTFLPRQLQHFAIYGSTFSIRSWWSSRVLTRDPLNVEAFFSSKAKDYGNEPLRLAAMKPFCGRGFITADGATWKRSRALLQPSFHKSNVSDTSKFVEAVDLMISNLPKDGSTVDLQSQFYNLFLDTASQFILGYSMGSVSNDPQNKMFEESQTFLNAFHTSEERLAIHFVLGPFRDLYWDSTFRTSCKVVHRYIDKHVEIALRSKTISNPQLDLEKSGGGTSLLDNLKSVVDDRSELRSQILQGMMAAQETTSTLLSNVFFLLVRHPKVLARLREDAMDIDLSNADFDRLQGLKLLRNVLYETLHLYPVFPILDRAAVVNTTIPTGGGRNCKSPVFIPAGTVVALDIFALHRHESIYGPTAEEFDPDRWDNIDPSPWEYVPFGGGLRVCLGRQKALGEASYVALKVLKTFKTIESRDDKPWAGQLKLTVRNIHGCKVSLR